MKKVPVLPAIAAWAALALTVLGSAGCALYQMERELPEKYAEFLSEVRYLITNAERKTFLSTPDSGKDAFIEDFWARRDPDPDTSDNEVRSEYYARIAQANEMFRRDAVKGWLTDRGRIYVLYGPPDEKRVPMLAETSGRNCLEIWYYKGFPIQFLDEMCTGNFRQVTFDLAPLKELRLNQPPAPLGPDGSRPGEPGRRPAQPVSRTRGARAVLDFSAELRSTVRRADRMEGMLRLEIPFRLIWFKSEGGRFLTTFTVFVRVRDEEKKTVWEKTFSAEANYDETEIHKRDGDVHVIEIPIYVIQEDALARLAAGTPTVEVKLTNQTGSEDVEKSVEWK